MMRRSGWIVVMGVAACGSGPDPMPGPPADQTPPRIVSLQPADGAASVPLDADVRVSFSEPINPATIAAASFFVTTDGTAIGGAYMYEGMTAIFVPDSSLDSLTVYSATITAAVRDPAGNQLMDGAVWSFTTGSALTPIGTGGR